MVSAIRMGAELRRVYEFSMSAMVQLAIGDKCFRHAGSEKDCGALRGDFQGVVCGEERWSGSHCSTGDRSCFSSGCYNGNHVWIIKKSYGRYEMSEW